MCKSKDKIYVSDKCYVCCHDCKRIEPITHCEHFKKGLTRKEYVEIIKSENINVKTLCDKYNLDRNIMYRMLGGKQNFSYKYRVVLDSRIFELNEFLPYVDKFDCEVEING